MSFGVIAPLAMRRSAIGSRHRLPTRGTHADVWPPSALTREFVVSAMPERRVQQAAVQALFKPAGALCRQPIETDASCARITPERALRRGRVESPSGNSRASYGLAPRRGGLNACGVYRRRRFTTEMIANPAPAIGNEPGSGEGSTVSLPKTVAVEPPSSNTLTVTGNRPVSV